MKTTTILIILFLFTFLLSAQTAEESIRYSQNTISETAGTAALGGAVGAVGGDFGAFSKNPACIAMSRQDHFTFTPIIYSNKSNSTYLGNSSNDRKFKLGISNLGYVSNFYGLLPDNTGNLVNGSFAIGFNQKRNFNNRRIINGFNDQNSVTGYFTGDGFIDNIPNNVEQLELKNTSGFLNEFLLGLGLDFNEKLLLGLNLSIPFIKFIDETAYIESDPDNYHQDFDEFRIDEFLETTGYGLNAKIGAIYIVNENIRTGLAYHFPTIYEIRDYYRTDLAYTSTTSFNEINYKNGIFDYELKTPSKWVASLALLYPKLGFISMDYELINYSNNKYSDTEYFSELNQEINTSFTTTSNFRIGGEYEKDKYRLRLGYALLGNPSVNKNSGFSAINVFTCGAGFHSKNISLDFAYTFLQDKYDYRVYGDSPISNVTDSNNNFMLTLGLKPGGGAKCSNKIKSKRLRKPKIKKRIESNNDNRSINDLNTDIKWPVDRSSLSNTGCVEEPRVKSTQQSEIEISKDKSTKPSEVSGKSSEGRGSVRGEGKGGSRKKGR